MALTIYGMFIPRVVIFFLYIFSEWFTGVFSEWYWLALGFFLLPCSTLWYSAVINWHDGVWDPVKTSVLAFALIVDLLLISQSSSKA